MSKSRGDRVSLDFPSPSDRLRCAGPAARCELERGEQGLEEGGEARSALASQHLPDNTPSTAHFLHSLSQLAQGLLAKQAKLVMLHLGTDKETAWLVPVSDCFTPQ